MPPLEPAKMKSHLTGALALTSLALLAACGKPPGMPGMGAPGTPEVGVVTLAPRALTLRTELSGRVVAAGAAEVRPQVGGIVQSRPFREGALVRAGELLYQIDPAPYQASVASAQAALAKAEANLAGARTKAQRQRELMAVQATSQQDADDAQVALGQAEADAAAARASLQTARINLGYTRVTAPIAGRIGRSAVTPGALVSANQATALATVQQLDPIHIDVAQSSADWLRLRRALDSGTLRPQAGARAGVQLLLPDGSTYAQTGRLEFAEAAVDASADAVTLRVEVPNPRGELLPGMYVRAVVAQGERAEALLVPQQALSRDAKGHASALVVGSDNKVAVRAVVTERQVGSDWLVSSGLAAGERVVVDGLQRVRPGSEVKAVAVAAAASGAVSAAATTAAPAAAVR